MKDNEFLKIVNPKMSKTHKATKFLRTKADFIDDLLESESIYNIQTSIKDFFQVEDNAKDNYYILNRFCKALEGIEQQILLEKTRDKITNYEQIIDSNKIQRLQIDKIDLIKDLANWLFA